MRLRGGILIVALPELKKCVGGEIKNKTLTNS